MSGDLDLFDKRLLVVSGKGGVGKTVVSAALALIASGMGKNVLLVKLDDQGRTGALFGAEKLTDRISPLCENISGVNLDPTTVVADYFHKQLRVRTLVKHIVNSRLFQNWFRVSPAIKEMVLLGKVWDLVEERSWWRSKPVWDLVIFDAPATGHGLGYLQLPEQASKLLIGPMRKNALGVQAMLENPTTTSLLLVTLPEEMPVNEAVHFYDQAKAELRVPLAAVVLNQVAPKRFSADAFQEVEAALEQAPVLAAAGSLLGEGLDPQASSTALLEAASYSQARRSLCDHYGDELRERIDLPIVEVPYVFSEQFGFSELEVVAKTLQSSLVRTRAESARLEAQR